jgi:pantoate--beta-alanine ligase
MIIFKQKNDISKYIELQKQTATIGFVPTMGALHLGHIALIENSKANCNITVCSIFINPTQFNDAKDFEKYPQTLENDILMLENAGCDVLFLPTVAQMYPNGILKIETYKLGKIETVLEGSFRPGHFNGVCNIVFMLLQIINPSNLYLGKKDFQQCMVIKKMMELKHLDSQINVVLCETKRLQNGLAMSSRNQRLTMQQQETASTIYEVLHYIKTNIQSQTIESLLATASSKLLAAGFDKIDYVSIAESSSLLPITIYNKDKKTVALVAAFLGGVRLIDNLEI